jgi:ABC-type phosphate transport system ATPase subunit
MSMWHIQYACKEFCLLMMDTLCDSIKNIATGEKDKIESVIKELGLNMTVNGIKTNTNKISSVSLRVIFSFLKQSHDA